MSLFDRLFGKTQPPRTRPAKNDEGPGPNFPFPTVRVAGDAAEAELLRMRREVSAATGCPVIIGDSESARRLVELWGVPFDLQAHLQRAEACDAEEWFRQRKEEEPDLYSETAQDAIHAAGTAPMTRLTIGYDFENRPRPVLHIAKVPTTDSATIPLHLRFGGWNDCPLPHVHAAVARYWRERYGAEIATVASDIVEFTVTRPPADHAQALELAWQQFHYCNDIVDQGVGSVATLARALLHSTRWYFWWD